MIFNKSRNWDFPPELHFSNGTQILCISETKLVGVILSEDLRWEKNTLYICQKAREKLWILRRMSKLDLNLNQMFDVYAKEVRSLLELAVPVWNAGLTKKQTADIERIQKVAFKIILDYRYTSYEMACQLFNAQTLDQRRQKLCLNFATKNLKSENSFFTKTDPTVNTRAKKPVREFRCNTGRFEKTSLPYMAKLLNNS